MTGGELLDECATVEKAPEDLNDQQAIRQVNCLYYIQGVTEGLLLAGKNTGRFPTFCLPKDYNYLQMARIIVKTLRERPESHHIQAVVLIPVIYNHFFPCNAKK